MKKTYTKKDAHQEITDKVIAMIEAASDDWSKPWLTSSLSNGMPTNIASKKPYRGINVAMLMMTDFTSNLWGTYKQWGDKGFQVQKGSKGTMVVLWKPMAKDIKDPATGDTEKKEWMMLRTFTVFNADQTDYEEPAVDGEERVFNAIENAEEYVQNTGVELFHGGDRAFYVPSRDIVQMPTKTDFHDEEGYYATLLHELTHWTGHKSRADRSKGMQGRFGTEAYAAEELVAELGAAILCATLGITQEPREDHAKYLKSWLKVLKSDKKAIFTAASKAQQAVDYLDSLQVAEESTEAA